MDIKLIILSTIGLLLVLTLLAILSLAIYDSITNKLYVIQTGNIYRCNRSNNCNLVWNMNHIRGYNVIRIGCKQKTKEDWDWFFGEHCTITYDHNRRSPEFKKIKKDYYQFVKQVEKL